MTGNPRNAVVCDALYLQSEFSDPRFFYVFNIILPFSTCSQSFKKICTWEVLGANVLKRANNRFIFSYSKLVLQITNGFVYAIGQPPSLSTWRKYPVYGWSHVMHANLRSHRRWVLGSILSTLPREGNVVLLYRR